MKNTITKYLLILLAISFILVVTISYLLYLKKSAPPAPGLIAEPGQEETAPPPALAPPLEAQIGTVMDVSVQPDGTVQIIVDEKTYQLPADQEAILHTSLTESSSIPVSQLKKGIMINVIKYINPDKYVINAIVDETLVEKLI